MSEDPRELARRLADQAKAKTAEQARVKAAAQADAKALAKKLVDDAKARLAPPATPVAPPPMPTRNLSALEAMRLAIDEEKRAASTPSAPAAFSPAASSARAVQRPAPVVANADPRATIARRLPGFEVVEIRAITQRDTFRALWTAHRVRAAVEGDASLLVTADVLLDAASRIPDGALFGARIRRDGRDHALFLDAAAGVLLGLTAQPDLYLAGL